MISGCPNEGKKVIALIQVILRSNNEVFALLLNINLCLILSQTNFVFL